MLESNPLVRIWHYRLLWIVAALSLGLNVLILGGLLYYRSQVRRIAAQAAEDLNAVSLGNFDTVVEIDETLSVDTTVQFTDTFVVPINTQIPVDTTVPFEDTVLVPINATLPVNTTFFVPVEIPFAGTFSIRIPIFAQIPVNLDVEVPISREIPVQFSLPVDIEVEVPIDREIPIQLEVPVKLNVPVSIPLDDTQFERLLIQTQQTVNGLARLSGAELAP